MVKSLDAWPELDFVRDEGGVDDTRPHEPNGWELIVFELEDEEEPTEITP